MLHLLYSRFWHKLLYDRGHVCTPEPFYRLINQGMILGEMEFTAYRTDDGQWVSGDRIDESHKAGIGDPGSARGKPIRVDPGQVEKRGDNFVLKENPSIVVDARAYEMSKSRGNVVNPDKIVEEYGADSMRMYEMFMGPLEVTKPWSTTGVEGIWRFLNRVWRMIVDDVAEDLRLADAVRDQPPTSEELRVLHRTIKVVTEDMEGLRFNTAISRMMEFINFFHQREARPRSVMEDFVRMLGPFAPHLAEELWRALGHSSTIAYEPWPAYDEALTQEDQIELPVQVNGKVRARLTAPADANEAQLRELALADSRIKSLLDGKTVKKVIVVPKKLVNIVVG